MSALSNKLSEINSWSDFFAYANSISEKGKGDLFEHVTKLILTTKPEYNSILNNVWLYNEIPNHIRKKLHLPSRDEGIDLIAETYDEKYWAIQCKFKGHNEAPTYKELSTFGQLANNYCKNISLALLVHTGEKGVRKSHLLGEKYSEIGLEFWLGLTSEDWVRIHKRIKHQSIRPQARKPRPHQQKAIEGAIKHFVEDKAFRGRMLMPCGTGKSLTAFWIANKLKARSIIVAVPSLALIKQSLEDWTREFTAQNESPRPQWLVICSDESTAKLEKDEFVSNAYSLGIPTTTDINEISTFLARECEGRKIVFTTYQSSNKLTQAARQAKCSFDLAILDEAHKTVGVKSKTFATLLLDKNITIAQRMFMTATERIFKGDNDEVLSMDDPDIYGDLFYQLTFKEAIHTKPPIICDYNILTISVTNNEIEELITKNKLINFQPEQDRPQESQSLAAAIALRKAIQKYGIQHAISFHRSIKSADSFSELHKSLNEVEVDNITLSSKHISSKKSAGERARLLSDFVSEAPALMTNARCLTEGVDVPAIDCVLFADPKQSIIDIVQASGRALRPYSGKERGYIMLPLIVPDDIPLDEFTDSTPFKEVARIIAALSTQDEMIAEEFRTISSGSQFHNGKIKIDGSVPVGMKLDLRKFADKIYAKIWERVAKVNWRPFPEARAFVQKLKLNNQADWLKYCISGSKPSDIPYSPERIYSDEGWLSLGDWLGTGTVATQLRQYRPFNEARVFAHELHLKSGEEWFKYCQSGNKPEDIPNTPILVYADNGWLSWGDWLGTGYIAGFKRKYLPFKEARAFAQKLGLKSGEEWMNYCQSEKKPENIPYRPQTTYKGKGWTSMGDWLGTGRVASQFHKYRSLIEAKTFVHRLKLHGQAEWRTYCQSGNKPEDIPSKPERTYKDKGWAGFGDWIGTGTLAPKFRKYLPFDEARAIVQKSHLKGYSDWKKYCKSGDKPNDIPSGPIRIYSSQGWAGWGDWLGTGTIASRLRAYRPFIEAREFVHKLNLQNSDEWYKYCRSGSKPKDIPANPLLVYSNKGWLGMRDWLGPRTIDNRSKKYRSYDEARTFVISLMIKNGNEWKKYCNSGNKPDDIPAKPYRAYKNDGWKRMGDWLGTGTIANYLKTYRPFYEARNFVNELKLKNQAEWFNYCKSGERPEDIPFNPGRTYVGKGWAGFGDWLGTGTIASRSRQYRSFDEARMYVRKLGLKSAAEWKKYCRSGEKPDDIPTKPYRTYINKGWRDWRDWLGKGL